MVMDPVGVVREMILIVHGENVVTLEAAKTDMNRVLETLGLLVRVKQ